MILSIKIINLVFLRRNAGHFDRLLVDSVFILDNSGDIWLRIVLAILKLILRRAHSLAEIKTSHKPPVMEL